MIHKKVLCFVFVALAIGNAQLWATQQTSTVTKETTGKAKKPSHLKDLHVRNVSSKYISSNAAHIKKLITDKIKTEQLFADVTLTDSLWAHNGKFENLLADLVVTTSLNADNAVIADILSDCIYTEFIAAQHAKLDTTLTDLVMTNSLIATDGVIANITNQNIDTNNIKTHILWTDQAMTELLTADTATIQELECAGLFADLVTTISLNAGLANLDLLSAHNIITSTISSHVHETDNLLTDLLISNSLEANHAEMIKLCVTHIDQVEDLLADTIVTSTLAVQNLYALGNFENATTLKVAASNHIADIAYILGTDITFDTIDDDRNNAITQLPTTYHVPHTGYYIVSCGVNTINISVDTPPQIPTGIHLDVVVNGVPAASAAREFRKILPQWQKSILLNNVMHLEKGDQVTFRLFATNEDIINELEFDDTGTATLGGSPLKNETFMAIHYLSSD